MPRGGTAPTLKFRRAWPDILYCIISLNCRTHPNRGTNLDFKDLMPMNRRRHPRISIHVPVVYRTLNTGEEPLEPSPGVVIDVSPGGVLLRSSEIGRAACR